LKKIGTGQNLFVAKYSPGGTVLWAKNASVTSWNVTHQGSMSPVAVDNAGNVYVAGAYEDNAIFGADTLLNFDSSGTSFDIFLTKYDANGNFLWAKRFGNKDNWDFAMAVAADASGNVLLTGFFASDTLNFDSTYITNNSPGSCDIFLAKFDANGNVLWAKSAGGTDNDQVWSVAVDASGNSFITGFFDSQNIIFGSSTIINTEPGNDAVFIAKYDANGNPLWAKSAGTGGDDGYSVAVDASGNAYVGGSFFSTKIAFGSITLSNEGAGDIFIAKYDANGNVLWAKRSGGNSDDRALSVAADASGNVYATGYFDSPSITFDAFVLTNAIPDYDNMFFVKYNSSGNVLWAKKVGGTHAGDDCDGASVAVTNNSGDVYLAGYYDAVLLDFDTISVTNTVGSDKLFLAKLGGNCLAYFSLSPDTAIPHNYWAVNLSTGVPPISYLWSWGDGTFDTTAYPSHTYSTAGYYTICLQITDSTGCTCTYCDSSAYLTKTQNSVITVNVVPSIPSGINEKELSDRIKVYPNPATDNITIIAPQKSIIEILNIQGQTIIQQPLQQGKTDIDISSIAKGVYILRLYSNDKTEVTRIVKE
jgi:hypothetical protein